MPLALRSYELWREIGQETGTELLTITGGLTLESQKSEAVMHGRRDFLDQAIRCAEKFHIRHEILETADIRKRYPQFAVTDERAYLEYETGFLRPELCIEAQLDLARKHGAAVRKDEIVCFDRKRRAFRTDGQDQPRRLLRREARHRRRPLDRPFLTAVVRASVQGVPPSHVLV